MTSQTFFKFYLPSRVIGKFYFVFIIYLYEKTIYICKIKLNELKSSVDNVSTPVHRSLYNDSQTFQFHMLFPYQNNLKKYYYSEDLKRKTPIVLIVVYCVNFDLCPTFRLCLKRVKQRYICERYVFGCQLCVRWPSSRQSFVRKSKPPYSITSPVTV